MVTKGRYQTKENTPTVPLKWSVIDTEGTTLGERFMCACREENDATIIANALNFNYKPSEYGYKLVE